MEIKGMHVYETLKTYIRNLGARSEVRNSIAYLSEAEGVSKAIDIVDCLEAELKFVRKLAEVRKKQNDESQSALKAEREKATTATGRSYLHCVMPTEEDLDWVINGTMKHSGGPEAWWKQLAIILGPREIACILITVWEAGRMMAAQRSRREAGAASQEADA